MQIRFAILLLLISRLAEAQSPSLSVQLSMDMDDANTATNSFKIEMKFCDPLKKTDKGGWFTNDTSDIVFSKLTADEISCGRYRVEGEGIEVLSGRKEEPQPHSFRFSNQVFAWEKILVFRITGTKPAHAPMYIIMPIAYKGFISSVIISDVKYRSGQLIFIDNAAATFPKQRLLIEHSLKHQPGIAADTALYKSWVED